MPDPLDGGQVWGVVIAGLAFFQAADLWRRAGKPGKVHPIAGWSTTNVGATRALAVASAVLGIVILLGTILMESFGEGR